MRIARVANHFPSGGAIGGDLEPNYLYLSRHAAARGHEVHILCGRRPGEPPEEALDGVRIHRVAPLPNRQGYLWGGFAKALVRHAKALRPDIVHGHMSYHFALALRKEKLGVPVLTHFHTVLDGALFMEKPLLFTAAGIRYRTFVHSMLPEYLLLLARSTLVVAVSRFCADRIRHWVPRARIHVIYNGVDTDLFRPGPSTLRERFPGEELVLFSGRAVPWKGLHHLVRAVAHLRRERPVRLLVLGGERPDTAPFCAHLRKMAARWGYRGLTWLPAVPYARMPDYYRGVHVLAHPAFPDASPKALCEALACGTPVVAAGGGGNPEILEGTRNLMFRPGDWRDLMAKLDRVLDGGYGSVKTYPWERCGEGVLRVYEEALAGRRAGRPAANFYEG